MGLRNAGPTMASRVGLAVVLSLVVTACTAASETTSTSVPRKVFGEGATLPDRIVFDGMEAGLWRGPDHCDWDDTWMIHIRSDDLKGPTTRTRGQELPAPFPGDHLFVRDPSVTPRYVYEAEADLDRPLPNDARLLAASSDGYELWFADSDVHYIFLTSEDRTEAWVRAIEWNLCR